MPASPSPFDTPKPKGPVPAELVEKIRAQVDQAQHEALLASTPPLQHRMTKTAVGQAIAALQAQTGDGSTAPTHTGAPLLNCDLLRRLDSHPEQCPQWLQKADRKASRELVAWYIERGFASPEDTTDPGEPTEGEDTVEKLLQLPRPDPTTRDECLVEFLKCRRSTVYFIDNYCCLAHKELGIIPFRLWRWQAWMLARWHENHFSIALKARQIGVSECAAAYCHWLTRFYDTKQVIFISKSKDDAQYLLGRVKVMAGYLPQWLLPGVSGRFNGAGIDACTMVSDNTQEYVVDHVDDRGRSHISAIQSMAATEGAGRSRTAAVVVMDEMAHMQFASEIWDSVQWTAGGGGRIFVISTAKGMGNKYEKLWHGATSDEGNGFFPMFLSWNRHPDRDQDWYDTEKRKAEENNDLPHFHQECPSNPLEAFIQSGLPVFDQTYLIEHIERIKEEIKARKEQDLPAWREIDGLTVYEEALPGHRYIIGADTAGGGVEGDFDDANVVDRETGNEVAALHGHWPFHVFAAKLDELGHRYNDALLGVERNNTYGGAVLAELLNGRAHATWSDGEMLEYRNLYHQKAELAPGRHEDAQPGWFTNVRTKPMMVSSLDRALREHAYHPRSQKFLDEALVFSYDESGTKMSAPPGSKDDRVISRAIAVHLLLQTDMVAHALSFIHDMQTASAGRARQQQAAVSNRRQETLGVRASLARARGLQQLPGRQLRSGPEIPRVTITPVNE